MVEQDLSQWEKMLHMCWDLAQPQIKKLAVKVGFPWMSVLLSKIDINHFIWQIFFFFFLRKPKNVFASHVITWYMYWIIAGHGDNLRKTTRISPTSTTRISPLHKISTVECRYDAVQYNKILYTSLQWWEQNINEGLNLQKTHHISP